MRAAGAGLLETVQDRIHYGMLITRPRSTGWTYGQHQRCSATAAHRWCRPPPPAAAPRASRMPATLRGCCRAGRTMCPARCLNMSAADAAPHADPGRRARRRQADARERAAARARPPLAAWRAGADRSAAETSGDCVGLHVVKAVRAARRMLNVTGLRKAKTLQRPEEPARLRSRK